MTECSFEHRGNQMRFFSRPQLVRKIVAYIRRQSTADVAPLKEEDCSRQQQQKRVSEMLARGGRLRRPPPHLSCFYLWHGNHVTQGRGGVQRDPLNIPITTTALTWRTHATRTLKTRRLEGRRRREGEKEEEKGEKEEEEGEKEEEEGEEGVYSRLLLMKLRHDGDSDGVNVGVRGGTSGIGGFGRRSLWSGRFFGGGLLEWEVRILHLTEPVIDKGGAGVSGVPYTLGDFLDVWRSTGVVQGVYW
ncbi:hypothetical protein Hamer_G011283 [Homarus americanus]|uniref:Uncharacterized protein n=1 Tax=Homarus americanus TaxID=6706 RepID=A0A8J5JHW7_HOMAM|nr:hypothetical protein Hamer_G011283 [Homarus americanus]